MFLVGLTGGIASGKSTVSSILEELGVKVICGDKIAREIVQPGEPAWHEIREAFGQEFFLPSGSLDREKLGQYIFSDSEARQRLNRITHPKIHWTIIKRCLTAFICGEQFVVLDLPLLFEAGTCLKFVNTIIVVSCDEEQQKERLRTRNSLSNEEASSRISSQLPLSVKRERAHIVIDNTKDLNYLRAQVEQTVTLLRKSKAHWKNRLCIIAFIGLLITGVSYGIYSFAKVFI